VQAHLHKVAGLGQTQGIEATVAGQGSIQPEQGVGEGAMLGEISGRTLTYISSL